MSSKTVTDTESYINKLKSLISNYDHELTELELKYIRWEEGELIRMTEFDEQENKIFKIVEEIIKLTKEYQKTNLL